MAWLVSHIWMVLAGVALFSILLGWAVRGMFLVNKLHRAIGDREVAVAELTEVKSELDTLYKAQRGELPTKPHPAQTGNPDGVLKQELRDRERRLAELADELAKSKSELEELKVAKPDAPDVMAAAGAAIAGAAAGAALTAETSPNGEESPTLEWRNRHLEARLVELEGALEAANASAAASVNPVEAPVESSTPALDPTVDAVAYEKAVWQASYLAKQVEALEEKLERAENLPVVASGVAVEVIEPVAEAQVESEAVALTDSRLEELNEELARLRWRNRYLEGRLAYFDGEAPAADAHEVVAASEEDGDAVSKAAALGVVGAASAGVASAIASIGQEDEGDAEPVEDVSVQAEAEDEADSVVDEGEATAEDLILPEFSSAENDDYEEASADLVEESETLSEAILKSLSDADEAADVDEGVEEDFDDGETVERSEDDAETDADSDEDGGAGFEIIDRELEALGALDVDENTDDHVEVQDDREEAADPLPLSPQATPLSPEQYQALSQRTDQAEDLAIDIEDTVNSDDSGDDEAVDSDDDEAVQVDTPSVAMTQPLSLDGPVEGHPDDLTVIGGIGPKIQEVLNGLGIYHYDQIAAWTPENVAWVDDHLSFGGRIEREGWVSQADVLAGEG